MIEFEWVGSVGDLGVSTWRGPVTVGACPGSERGAGWNEEEGGECTGTCLIWRVCVEKFGNGMEGC